MKSFYYCRNEKIAVQFHTLNAMAIVLSYDIYYLCKKIGSSTEFSKKYCRNLKVTNSLFMKRITILKSANTDDALIK